LQSMFAYDPVIAACVALWYSCFLAYLTGTG
jgi:hypothetical protein